MIYQFRTPCHPESGDRVPQSGDEGFRLHFATEDGGKLIVAMGREAFVYSAACMTAMLRDNPELRAAVAAEAETILAGPMGE